MICSKCQVDEADFVAPCGHILHISCLSMNFNFNCLECNNVVNLFRLFRDTEREAGINDSDEFYMEISGCSDALRGLVIWLIDHDSSGLIFLKIYSLYWLSFKPSGITKFERLVLEESLLKGDLRLAKHSCKFRPIKIDQTVLEKVWERDQLEILAEAYGLNMIFPYSEIISSRNPLIVAAKTGNITLLQRLITKAGAVLNLKESDHCALLAACKSESFTSVDDQFKFFDLLLESGADLRPGDELIQRAVEAKNGGLLQYLMSKGAKPSAKSMEWTIQHSNLAMVNLLHKSGVEFKDAKSDNDYQSSLRAACIHNTVDIAKYIVESGVDLEGEIHTLSKASFLNKFDMLELLLRFGVRPDNLILAHACSYEKLELVKLFIANGAKLTGFGGHNRLLHIFNFDSVQRDAAKISEIIEYFIILGADIDAALEGDSQPLLYKLCQSDKNILIIEKLIKLGANISTLVKSHIKTAFLCACFRGCPNVVRLLLRNGADPNECNQFDMNGYLFAICSGNLETVKITRALCHKNCVDNEGNGAFFFTSRLKSDQAALEIYEYLAEEGVDMNLLDCGGTHPLMHSEPYQSQNSLMLPKYFESKANRKFIRKHVRKYSDSHYERLKIYLDKFLRCRICHAVRSQSSYQYQLLKKNYSHSCPECGKVISTFGLFWDILKEAGMNQTEDFYNNLQCPFMKAIEKDNIKLLEYLISKRGRHHVRLMILAIRKDSLETVKLLHESGLQLIDK